MKARQTYDIQRVLQEMKEEYWRGIEEGAETVVLDTRDYLVFHLGAERYGIPTTSTREVMRLPRLVRVPRIAEHIRGVINLRGQIVAVTDLRPLLGLPDRELPSRAQLVVTEASGLLTALVVDKVAGIFSFAVETIEPFTEGLAGFPSEAAEGQVADAKGMLILLNMGHILSRPEFIIDQKTE